jgi:branched-chain amino acid transport system ATP-binding protein
MSENEYIQPALELINVQKHFDGLMAIDDFSLTVPKHVIHGLIGPNGAGKTTLFNIITGVYQSSAGEVRLFGQSLNGKKSHEIANLGIARTFQNIRLFNELTVFENLLTACQKNIHYSLLQSFLHLSAFRREEEIMRQKCYELLKNLGIEQLSDQLAGNLAYGNQRRVEIARALITAPRILLLDEPAAGMNEDESAVLSEIIKRTRNDYNITILVIDHHMDVIIEVCDGITVINFGHLLMTGTPGEIQQNQEVRDAYLGKDED